MSALTRAWRRLPFCRAGSTSVEFAIIAMVLVVVTLGTIEFGRGLDLRNRLSHAADYGARRILTDQAVSDSTLASVVRSAFTGSAPDLLTVAVGAETVSGVQFRTITLGYPLTLLIPQLSSGAITLGVSRRTPVI